MRIVLSVLFVVCFGGIEVAVVTAVCPLALGFNLLAIKFLDWADPKEIPQTFTSRPVVSGSCLRHNERNNDNQDSRPFGEDPSDLEFKELVETVNRPVETDPRQY